MNVYRKIVENIAYLEKEEKKNHDRLVHLYMCIHERLY